MPPPASSGPSPLSSNPSDPSDDPLLVEVQGENGAYYKAHVRDVFPESSEVLLVFERDWQPQSRFPFARVRLPPKPFSIMPLYTEQQEIEVYSRASDQVHVRMSHLLRIVSRCFNAYSSTSDLQRSLGTFDPLWILTSALPLFRRPSIPRELVEKT